MILYIIICFFIILVLYYLYYIYYYIDHDNICCLAGMNKNLTFIAKIINFIGSLYYNIFHSHMISLNIDKWLMKNDFNNEIKLLTNNWGSPSPIIHKNNNLLKKQELEYYKRFSRLINHPKSFWSPTGRIIQYQTFKRQITNRCSFINYVKNHSYLLEGNSIDDNNHLLSIMGMHRSGTSLLQNLLGLDPSSRTTRTWEMMKSIPPATNDKELMGGKRAKDLEDDFEKTKYLCKEWRANFHKLHYFTANGAEEDVMLLFDLFVFWYYSYFMEDIDKDLNNILRERVPYICRYLHFFLKVLDSSYKPKSHWILKNPDHSQYLLDFLNEFPSANIIVTHRHPSKTVPSWANMMLQCLHVQLYNDFTKGIPKSSCMTPKGWGKSALKQSSSEARNLMEARKILEIKNPQKALQILDISYTQLTNEPIKVIKQIYNHFGYEYTDEYNEILKEYIKNNPKHKKGKVSYSLEQFELNEDIINNEFKDYIKKYSQYF